eukprot:CAMPEP_0202706572 /NCGR_PEP_ID=MMETSP1385-20130828/18978_1 /ASSEMBLY_ACC=CAM_ASM_000861 /TAXON_ID=933848 /ORGANISM="Elphidium margaritaceum" /LENGTH=162 /DNA_ID=CAMNT_0049365075 /DNA_START=331 /DNA_END=819 /DNA_ORIENTATION=-
MADGQETYIRADNKKIMLRLGEPGTASEKVYEYDPKQAKFVSPENRNDEMDLDTARFEIMAKRYKNPRQFPVNMYFKPNDPKRDLPVKMVNLSGRRIPNPGDTLMNKLHKLNMEDVGGFSAHDAHYENDLDNLLKETYIEGFRAGSRASKKRNENRLISGRF